MHSSFVRRRCRPQTDHESPLQKSRVLRTYVGLFTGALKSQVLENTSTEKLSIGLNQDILQVWKMQVWKTQVRIYVDGIRKYGKPKYEFETVEKTRIRNT